MNVQSRGGVDFKRFFFEESSSRKCELVRCRQGPEKRREFFCHDSLADPFFYMYFHFGSRSLSQHPSIFDQRMRAIVGAKVLIKEKKNNFGQAFIGDDFDRLGTFTTDVVKPKWSNFTVPSCCEPIVSA